MKRPTLADPLTLGRAAAELAIIVVGVLMALGVDAWWTEREEAVRGAMYLERLADDLDTQLELLQAAQDGLTESIAGGDSVRAMLDGGPVPGGRPAPLVMGLFGPGRYEVPLADWTYTEMLGNAELALVADDNLRAAIVQYHATAQRFEARVQESRALLRNPAYARFATTPLLRGYDSDDRQDADALALIAEPDFPAYLEQLQTYVVHCRTLLVEWEAEAQALRNRIGDAAVAEE